MTSLRGVLTILAAGACLAACSVWPVNQDPDGIAFRQNANHIIWALQSYRHDHGSFPARLSALTPQYMKAIPGVPQLVYNPADGSLAYRYIPTFPQLRWTWCSSVGDTTNWHCAEHLI